MHDPSVDRRDGSAVVDDVAGFDDLVDDPVLLGLRRRHHVVTVGVLGDLLDRLATEPALGLGRTQIDAALGEPLDFVGTAQQQVATVVQRIEATLRMYPDAAGYTPELVL